MAQAIQTVNEAALKANSAASDVDHALDAVKTDPTPQNIKAVEYAQEYALSAASNAIDAADSAKKTVDNASKAETSIEESESSGGSKKCYTVNIKKLQIYDSASKYSDKVGYLTEGTTFCTLNEEGNWIEVEDGWVSNTFVSQIQTPSQSDNSKSFSGEEIKASIDAAKSAANSAESAAKNSEDVTDTIISNLESSARNAADTARSAANNANQIDASSAQTAQAANAAEKATLAAAKAAEVLQHLTSAADAANEDITFTVNVLKASISAATDAAEKINQNITKNSEEVADTFIYNLKASAQKAAGTANSAAQGANIAALNPAQSATAAANATRAAFDAAQILNELTKTAESLNVDLNSEISALKASILAVNSAIEKLNKAAIAQKNSNKRLVAKKQKATQARINKEPLKILRPFENTLYYEKFASVSVEINNNEVTNLELVINGSANFTIDINTSKKNTYCKSLPLKLGINNIKITTFNKNAIFDEKEVSVYYASEVFAGFDEVDAYDKNIFHNEDNEKVCSSCHEFEEADFAQDEPLDDPEESTCYECHKSLVSRKNSHAPSVNFICTKCHNGKMGELNNESDEDSKYIVPDPVYKNCFGCHEKIEDKWFSNKSEHGPVKSGRCNKCHNPHSSDNEFFLRKSIWELCTTCHAEKASGSHVIGGFVFGKSHPTKGRPDPARPGRELVCSGCHNPHGSNSKFLLRTEGMSSFSICKRCHNKY